MTRISFLQLLRLIFVLFSLFLMGDAFYRWDGFSYYASFSEFIPAIALIFIQWTVLAIILTVILWLAFRLLYYLCDLSGLHINFDYILPFSGIFLLVVAGALIVKKAALPELQTTLTVKLTILVFAAFIPLVLARILGKRFGHFPRVIQERITPLVWIFAAIFLLSFPIVAYHTWLKGPVKETSESIADPSDPLKNRPNIILVTFDALTARDMSVYGYHRATTPFLTEWAKGASLFTNVKAESTFTSPTTASLMTGKRLWSHLTWHQASPIQKKKSENIARELKKNGYITMAYIENSNASPVSLGIGGDFDKTVFMPEAKGFLDNYHRTISLLFHGKIRLYDWIMLDDFYPSALFQQYIYDPVFMPVYKKIFSGKSFSFSRDNTAFDKFISDIDKKAPDKPFFAWIHMYPPHSPYVPPEPFQGTFDTSKKLRDVREQTETIYRITRQKEGLAENDLEDMKTLRARYNEHILYSDKIFEDFIRNLDKRSMLEGSLLILSADHGEIFEHNSLMHAETPYEPVVHIPLIIKEPGQTEGKILNNVVEQIDIPATIMDMSGAPMPSWLEGRSLMPLMRGRNLPPRPAFTMHLQRNRMNSDHKITRGFISVYSGDYKLTYFLDKNSSLLFNLKDDPGEINDIFNSEPETGRRLLDLIKHNLEKANERIMSGT